MQLDSCILYLSMQLRLEAEPATRTPGGVCRYDRGRFVRGFGSWAWAIQIIKKIRTGLTGSSLGFLPNAKDRNLNLHAMTGGRISRPHSCMTSFVNTRIQASLCMTAFRALIQSSTFLSVYMFLTLDASSWRSLPQ